MFTGRTWIDSASVRPAVPHGGAKGRGNENRFCGDGAVLFSRQAEYPCLVRELCEVHAYDTEREDRQVMYIGIVIRKVTPPRALSNVGKNFDLADVYGQRWLFTSCSFAISSVIFATSNLSNVSWDKTMTKKWGLSCVFILFYDFYYLNSWTVPNTDAVQSNFSYIIATGTPREGEEM